MKPVAPKHLYIYENTQPNRNQGRSFQIHYYPPTGKGKALILHDDTYKGIENAEVYPLQNKVVWFHPSPIEGAQEEKEEGKISNLAIARLKKSPKVCVDASIVSYDTTDECLRVDTINLEVPHKKMTDRGVTKFIAYLGGLYLGPQGYILFWKVCLDRKIHPAENDYAILYARFDQDGSHTTYSWVPFFEYTQLRFYSLEGGKSVLVQAVIIADNGATALTREFMLPSEDPSKKAPL